MDQCLRRAHKKGINPTKIQSQFYIDHGAISGQLLATTDLAGGGRGNADNVDNGELR